MGRGRQKAKQTKVARELKYHTASIDVTALQRELSGSALDEAELDEQDEDDDPYGGYLNEDDDEANGYASPSRHR